MKPGPFAYSAPTTVSETLQLLADLGPDGKVLAFRQTNPGTGWDILTLPVEGDEKSGWKPGVPKPFVNTPFTDAISRVAELLRVRRRISFEELLGAGEGERATRATILATFLAILEMAKLMLVRIFQAPADESGPGSEIVVEAKDTLGEGPVAATEDYR